MSVEPSYTILQDILSQHEILKRNSESIGELSSNYERSDSVESPGLNEQSEQLTPRNHEKNRSPPLLVSKESASSATPTISIQELLPIMGTHPTPTESIKSTRESCRDGDFSIGGEYF